MTPYFRARRTAAGFDVEGTPTCELGHRLPDGDGIFAAWTWDGERLTVTNDRYGIYPLFYCERDGEIALSSSLAELVRRGAPTELDDVALAAFRYLGFFIQEDTPFRAIKVPPPAARFEWNGRLTVAERLPRPIGARIEIAREEALREFARLFREAVERRVGLAERFGLPLSGGHDSRHILLALLELGRRPAVCVTVERYPPTQNDDVPIAAALAARLGLAHVVAEQLSRYEAEVRKNVATHFLASTHAWYVAVADRLRETVDVVFDGLAGDELAPSKTEKPVALACYRSGRLDELADMYSRRFGSGTGERRSHSPFLASAEVSRLARGRIVRELERYAAAAQPTTQFTFWNLIRRETALLACGVCAGLTCLGPFLDHRLYDFLVSLPPEITDDGRFHTDAIAAAYPAYADIPYAGGGRGRRLGTSLSLAGRGAWDAVRQDPARAGDAATAVSRLALATLSRRYRRRNQVDNPQWLLYRWQLEDLRRAGGSLF